MRYLPLLLSLASTSAYATNWRSTAPLLDRAQFQTLITNLDAADTAIDAWAVEPDGDWFVAADDAVYHSPGFSPSFIQAAKWNLVFGRTLRAADCNAAGVCILVHSAGWYANGAIPAALGTTINSWTSGGTVIRDVELTQSGWLLLGPGSVASYTGLDADLRDAIWDRRATGRYIADVSIGTDGRWMLLADNNPMSEGLSASQRASLDAVVEGAHAVDKLLLGNSSSYVLYNHDDDLLAPTPGDVFSAIEQNAGGTNLWERMASYGIVGVSIAVVEDNEVVAGRGYGQLQLGADGDVLSSTPFDLASLSKYVGALTTLAALEERNYDGILGNSLYLDDDVLDIRVPEGNVDRWKADGELANPVKGFPDGLPALPEGMTFRRLLSHTGSMLSRGSTPSEVPWVSSAAPSVWMSGWRCVGGPCDWSTSAYAWVNPTFGAPGTGYNYSNSGFMLTQATLVDHFDTPGSVLMQDLLFDRMGLVDISGHYPLDEDFLARRSRQHDVASGLQVENEYPWTFAGGVNASAADYAELVIVAMNEGWDSAGHPILREDSVDALLTDNVLNDGTAVGYGLGVVLGDGTAREDNDAGFWHNGGHAEQAVTWFCGSPSRDQAIVVLLNTDSDGLSSNDPAHVNNFIDDVIDAWRASVGWPSAINCGI